MLATLRRLGRLDKVLAGLLDRPLPQSAGEARAILRLGAAQILELETPAYAAVDAMTELAGAARATRPFRGLVNAVLRRCSREGPETYAALSPSDDWPVWLMDSWRKAYGSAVANAIAAASGALPPLDLAIRDGDLDGWALRLGGEVIADGIVRLHEVGAVPALEGFEDGAWWVQDVAAGLPVRLLGNVKGLRVLDLCAAPGGKTLQLAAAGAEVTAVEKVGARAETIKENLARTRLNATVIVADAIEAGLPGGFDAVLVDAPCSATGTLRRHPDAAWSKRPGDIAMLRDTQLGLLETAAQAVKPGGRVVYCTCSLQPEEGEAIVDAARDDGLPLTLSPVARAELPEGLGRVDELGFVRTLPTDLADKGGADGFFAARLVRSD